MIWPLPSFPALYLQVNCICNLPSFQKGISHTSKPLPILFPLPGNVSHPFSPLPIPGNLLNLSTYLSKPQVSRLICGTPNPAQSEPGLL